MPDVPQRHPQGRTCQKALPQALLMTAVVLMKMAFGRLPKSW
jgi:multisubunit Na+/H+ antiporter MnhC subunit